MVTLRMSGHTFRFELENICRLFLPQEKVTVVDEVSHDEELTVVLSLHSEDTGLFGGGENSQIGNFFNVLFRYRA